MDEEGGNARPRARVIGPPAVAGLPELLARARALARDNERALLGITGPPGVGKSTLAAAVVSHVGAGARVVGMDGFHLSRARLADLGRLERMGAIDTFDGDGFVGLVARLRASGRQTVYAPEFCRETEESIVDALAIEPGVRLVVIEGNYLLAVQRPWHALRELLDEVWYCDRNEDARIADLIARHHAYGKSPEAARRWALGPDQRNAEAIATTRSLADLVVRLDGWLAGDATAQPHVAGGVEP